MADAMSTKVKITKRPSKAEPVIRPTGDVGLFRVNYPNGTASGGGHLGGGARLESKQIHRRMTPCSHIGNMLSTPSMEGVRNMLGKRPNAGDRETNAGAS